MVDKTFSRLERYMKIIAGSSFLQFSKLAAEDVDGQETQFLRHLITEGDISELLSIQRQKTGEMSVQAPSINLP